MTVASVADSLARFGLRPEDALLDEVREVLKTQTRIDVQFLCGAGPPETKAFLRQPPSGSEADDALEWLLEFEAAGDFENFSVERWSVRCRSCYSHTEA